MESGILINKEFIYLKGDKIKQDINSIIKEGKKPS